MHRRIAISLTFFVVVLCASISFGEIILSSSATAPTPDAWDQAYLGGPGTQHNSEDFTDNAGPPGQTFTTPSGPGTYYLNSVAMKGRGNSGQNAETSNWGVRVSSVSGTTLSSLLESTTITGTISTNTDWVSMEFTEADRLELQPNTTYAFEFLASAGWFGFESSDGVVTPPADAYLAGIGFNHNGTAKTFDSATLQDRSYDRTFYVDLAPVPEPSTFALIVAGLLGLTLVGKRRR